MDTATQQLVDIPIEDRSGFPVSAGAIYQDGTFTIGAVGRVYDPYTNDTIGEQLMLLSGRFQGDYLFLDSTQHVTARRGELMDDCQYEFIALY